MYIKKLTKIGRSFYALMPMVILQLISFEPEEDEMLITIEGNRIILEKAPSEKVSK